ncbi:scarecrow-like 3 [Populus alba x Populus x berolinensis]|nr:scarecrow-like 3 [Populus alba x Populus x berolinensis]
MEAFQLLHQATPYIAFGFMAANEAICQAAKEKDSLHIIDLGMEHALQWPSLMRTLAARPEGPPKLRITGLIDGHNLLELEASLKELAEEEGEALFVNSIMHLHKFVKESRGSLKAILQAIKKLNPALLTVVEQDANHNGPFFLGRFIESLHYYSAIFDCNIIAYEGSNRIERHERADQWRRQLSRAGFQVMGLKCMSQARMMLSVYGIDGYTLATEKGCLLLGWRGRPLMLASAWQVHNLFPS